MNRRDSLKILLGITVAQSVQWTPEQAVAQTANELEALLREAVRKNNGEYAGSVLKYPREVGAELGLNVSEDTVSILRALNGQIEPDLLPKGVNPGVVDPVPYPWYVENPSAIEYFEKVLNQDEFDVRWYDDVEKKAGNLNVAIDTETAQAISRLGNSTVNNSIAAGEEVQAGGVVIVAAIVVVIAFGPRGKAAVEPDIGLTVSPSTDPGILPMVPNPRNPYPTIGYPVVDPSWASKF